MTIATILIFGGGMLAAGFVIKTLEMSGKHELAKQVEMLTVLVGSITVIGTLAVLLTEVKTVFGM